MLDNPEKVSKLLAALMAAAPFEVELSAAAVSEIVVCLQAEAFRRSIGRYVRVLFGAQESLVRARATAKVAEEAGGGLATANGPCLAGCIHKRSFLHRSAGRAVPPTKPPPLHPGPALLPSVLRMRQDLPSI